MPDDPLEAAATARQALRQLAHATMDPPAEIGDAYGLLGVLAGGLASLRQVLDQLAGWHDAAAGRASDGKADRAAGRREALLAGAALREARTLIAQAGDRVDQAWAGHGRITWHSVPPALRPTPAIRSAPHQPTRDAMGR